MAARGSSIAYYIFGRLLYQESGNKTNSTAITMESQNCLMILMFIILGGYVIILGGYVIMFGD